MKIHRTACGCGLPVFYIYIKDLDKEIAFEILDFRTLEQHYCDYLKEKGKDEK